MIYNFAGLKCRRRNYHTTVLYQQTLAGVVGSWYARRASAGVFCFGATQLKTKVDKCAWVEWADEFCKLAKNFRRIGKLYVPDEAEHGRRQVWKYGVKAGELLVETAELWEDTSLSLLKDETVPEVHGIELSKAQKDQVRQSHFYALWIKYCRRLYDDERSVVCVGHPQVRHYIAEVYMDGEYSLSPFQAYQFGDACSKIADKLPQLIEAANKRAKPAKKGASGQLESDQLEQLRSLILQLHRQAVLQKSLNRKVSAQWLIEWVKKTLQVEK